MVDIPTSFRWVLLSVVVANTAATVMYEFFVVSLISMRWVAAQEAAQEKATNDLLDGLR